MCKSAAFNDVYIHFQRRLLVLMRIFNNLLLMYMFPNLMKLKYCVYYYKVILLSQFSLNEINQRYKCMTNRRIRLHIDRGGQRSFQMERSSRSMLKIGAALPLHIFKRSGAAVSAPAPREWSTAHLPLLLNKTHYI